MVIYPLFGALAQLGNEGNVSPVGCPAKQEVP